MTRIAIASDHAGLEMKTALVAWLRDAGHEVSDLGPQTSESVDYPGYGYKVARAIAGGAADRGVAICGSGIGISIAVNRHPDCRCALVSEPLSASFARSHNDANVVALGSRMIGIEMAKACLEAFLGTDFADADSAAGRHAHRVDQLSNPLFEETE